MGVASDTLAAINREQWDDYKARFIPRENQLIDAYDNPALRQERMDAATGYAASSADSAQGVAARQMSRYGLNNDSQAGQREAGLTKTASIVDAQNTSRDQMNARDQLLLAGGLTSRGV
jgi:hypothetical protein